MLFKSAAKNGKLLSNNARNPGKWNEAKTFPYKDLKPTLCLTQLGQGAKPNWKHSLNNTPGVVPLLRHDDTSTILERLFKATGIYIRSMKAFFWKIRLCITVYWVTYHLPSVLEWVRTSEGIFVSQTDPLAWGCPARSILIWAFVRAVCKRQFARS